MLFQPLDTNIRIVSPSHAIATDGIAGSLRFLNFGTKIVDGGHTVFTVVPLAFVKPEIDFVLKLLVGEEARFLELGEPGRCPIDRILSIL